MGYFDCCVEYEVSGNWGKRLIVAEKERLSSSQQLFQRMFGVKWEK